MFALYEVAACSPHALRLRILEVGSFEHKGTGECPQDHALPSRH
jgi:hypothetical protein